MQVLTKDDPPTGRSSAQLLRCTHTPPSSAPFLPGRHPTPNANAETMTIAAICAPVRHLFCSYTQALVKAELLKSISDEQLRSVSKKVRRHMLALAKWSTLAQHVLSMLLGTGP